MDANVAGALQDVTTGLIPFVGEESIAKGMAKAILSGINAGLQNSDPKAEACFPARPDMTHDEAILAECVHSLTLDLVAARRPKAGLTLVQVKAELNSVNVTIRKRDGEYRVNLRGGGEATAYYTNDLEDARQTGLAMARSV